MNGSGWLPIHHFFYFVWINGYAFTKDGESQEFHTIQLKFTFREFGIKLMISKTLKNNTEMLGIFFFIFGVYEDVINEDHNKLVKLEHKHRIHEIHEVGRSIREPERHD